MRSTSLLKKTCLSPWSDVLLVVRPQGLWPDPLSPDPVLTHAGLSEFPTSSPRTGLQAPSRPRASCHLTGFALAERSLSVGFACPLNTLGRRRARATFTPTGYTRTDPGRA